MEALRSPYFMGRGGSAWSRFSPSGFRHERPLGGWSRQQRSERRAIDGFQHHIGALLGPQVIAGLYKHTPASLIILFTTTCMPRIISLLLIGLLAQASQVLATTPAKTGDVLLAAPCASLQGWHAEDPDGIRATIDQRTGALYFELSSEDPIRNNKISYPLPAAALRGATIHASARIRTENVSPPPNPWNGPKLLFQVSSKSGAPTSYPDVRVPPGTADWKEYSVVTTIPTNVAAVQFVAGLENVTGKAWIADLKITVIEGALDTSGFNPPPGPPHKGHSAPRLRGAMVPTSISADSLRVLGRDWGANLIRWQIGGTAYKDTGLETENYDEVLQSELARFDAILPACEQNGLRVVLDLHSLSKKLFNSPTNQDRLVATWRHLATRYKGRDIIWAYDIANEPSQVGWSEGALLWNDLAVRVARAIREIDADKTIIVEGELFANPESFETLRPLPVPNIVYSFHMYHPGQYTHSRIWNPRQEIWTYPGIIEGKQWDKSELKRALAPVIAFQKRYNAHIYVGEFGAVRWAKGSAQYLADLIDIFEENHWDWSIHAFREWHGWSAEHGDDMQITTPSPTPTDREQLLRRWFGKNKEQALSR